MKNIKEKVLNLFKILKKSLEKFPFTIIGILILTVIYTICLDNNLLSVKTIENTTIFIIIFSSSCFLIETLLEDSIKKRAIYYIISVFLAGMLTYFCNIEETFLGMENEIFLYRITRIIVCYLLSVILLGIYYNFKKSNKTFEEYLTNTIVNMFKTSLIYGIFSIGIATITAIFVYLILDGSNYIWIARMEVLLFGIYYIPTIIYTFYNKEEQIGKFAQIVIKYVLGTLVMSAFVIIYMYIIKIILLRNMPSNQIFRILSALFIIGLPIWTMILSFKDESIFNKINKKLPLLFIPFIILQIYSIGIRIHTNGITPLRYLCLMLLIFEIIYTIMYIKHKEKIGNMLLALISLTIISIIVPYINMFNISNYSQYQNLKIYKQKSEYTDEEKTKIYGAYYYLKYSIEGKKLLDNLTEQELDEIEVFKNSMNETNQNRAKSIYAEKRLDYVQIEGYKKLYTIDSNYYRTTNQSKTIDDIFSNFEFDIKNSNTNDTIKVNILPLVKQCINYGEDITEYFDGINKLQIDNDTQIILEEITIRYNEDTNKVDYYNISGYLLSK